MSPLPALPRSDISSLKAKLSHAIGTKNPSAASSAVELPPFPSVGADATLDGEAVDETTGSNAVHGEMLKVDGVDWSNVFNALLDTHAAIRTVGRVISVLTMICEFCLFWWML